MPTETSLKQVSNKMSKTYIYSVERKDKRERKRDRRGERERDNFEFFVINVKYKEIS